nr:alkyl sulfatase dimerization domain-containing protein [Pseudomonas atacamensis]
MRAQRDAYANLNNAVLHAANQGVTINEIHNVYKLPQSLKNNWATHSYHGSEEHNSRAVINRYLGYWDANPATLMPLSPTDSAPLYVEMMGGAGKIMTKGKALFDQGKYREAYEILNKLVYAEPQTSQAKDCWRMSMSRWAIRKKVPACATASLLRPMSCETACPRACHPNSAGRMSSAP